MMISAQELLRLFWQQVKETDLLQWLAVWLGVAEVLLARVNNIWLYPAGIAGTLLSIWILQQSGLFAEALLNVYYVIMSVYGWWHWIKKRDQPQVVISRCTRRDWFIVLAIVTGSFALLYALLALYTPSTVPFWDAWVSATAWAGMWLLAQRKLENWLLLNISNLFAIPLLFYKQLPMFALLTIFLFVVAVFGYYDWRRQVKKRESAMAV
jgi:nicotinamide mononucleotide transporter